MNPVKVELMQKIMTAHSENNIKDALLGKLNKYIKNYYITGVRDENALKKYIANQLKDKRHQGSKILPIKKATTIAPKAKIEKLPKVMIDDEVKRIMKRSEKRMKKMNEKRTFDYAISMICYYLETKEQRNKNDRYTTIEGRKFRAYKVTGHSDLNDNVVQLNMRYVKKTKEYIKIVKSLNASTYASVFQSDAPTYISVTSLTPEITRQNYKDANLDMFADDVDELATLLMASATHSLITNKFITNNVKILIGEIVSALQHNELNECCINALLNCYFGTKQFSMSRQAILQIIDKTEEDIKNGLSINDMMPIFEHYNISARIYNSYHKCIYCYEGNPKIKIFYALVKDNHMYIMDNETHAISYYPEYCADSDEMLKVSKTFRLTDEKKKAPIHEYCIINNYDDVVKYYCAGIDKDVTHNLLMNKGKHLYDLYVEAKNKGCEPIPCMKANDIVKLIFKFNKIYIIVYSLEAIILHPSHSDVLPTVDYSYLKLYQKANNKLRDDILNKKYISQYSKYDVEMFKTAFTAPQSYMFSGFNNVSVDEMNEIDRIRIYIDGYNTRPNIQHF